MMTFGIEPATIGVIVTTVAALAKQGYSFYQAYKMTEEREKALKEASKSELDRIVDGISKEYPTISRKFIKQELMRGWIERPKIEHQPKKEKKETSVWTYVVVGVLGYMILGE